MFGFRLISRGRGAVDRSGFGRRWLALFWGLALVPLLGWGLEILEHPQDEAVCVGEDARFTSKVSGAEIIAVWKVNNTLPGGLSSQIAKHLDLETTNLDGITMLTLVILSTAPAEFNGTKVEAVAGRFGGNETSSMPAYLIYKSNQQSPAINPGTTVNQTAIQVSWQASDTTLPNSYYLSFSDITASEPIPVTCDDCKNITGTYYSFDTNTDGSCHIYDVRVTEFRILHPECNITEPTEYASANAIIPEIAPITIEYTDRAVRADWVHDGRSSYRVVITHHENNTLVVDDTCNHCPPYYFVPESCGMDYHLNLAVTPEQCPDTRFTRKVSIRFHADCLKVTRFQDIETGVVQGASAVSRVNIPGLLLLVALLPLL